MSLSKKKTWRKTIKEENFLQDLEQHNKDKDVKAKQSSLKDSDLYKVNIDKTGLKQKREKLNKDRFKEKEREKSHYEVDIIKKLVKRVHNKKEHPPHVKKDSEDENDLMDLWGDEGNKSSKRLREFKDFTEKTRIHVKPIVKPLGGWSYNPSAKDHQEVIQKVVQEELKDVEEAQKRLRHLKPYLFKEHEEPKPQAKTIDNDLDSDDEDDEDEQGEEITNKAVDRKKKLTKTQRNLKLQKKQNREQQDKSITDKKWNKEFNKLPMIVKEQQRKEQEIKDKMERKRVEELAEKLQQESIGVVTKPVRIGKYKYKMRKTDFQTEEELTGSLRKLKSQATPADLLLERYDSVFRRNLIEPEAPINADKKRSKKAKFKWHEKGGKAAKKLGNVNQKLKEKMDSKFAGKNSILKDDLILL